MSSNIRSRKRDLDENGIISADCNHSSAESDERSLKTRRTDQLGDFSNPNTLDNWVHNLSKKYDKSCSKNNDNTDNGTSLEVEIRGLIKFVEKMTLQRAQKILNENKFLSNLVKSQQETIRHLQDWERIANYYLQERNALKAELNDLKDSIALAFAKPKTNQHPNKPPFIHRSPPDIF